ncbi:MAG: hypothetical protein QM804_10295 [Propionicimonas sp.]
MSVPTTEPTPAVPAAQPTPTPTDSPKPDTGDAPVDWKAEAEKWKSLSRKHEDASKANADKAKLYDDAQEAAKTEAQKQADALAKLAAENEALKVSNLRAQVAEAKGVPAALLTGSTQAEIEAAAEALLAFRGEAPKPPAAPPATGQGNVGEPVGAKGPQLTRGQVQGMTAEEIVKAKAAGQLDDLLSGRLR